MKYTKYILKSSSAAFIRNLLIVLAIVSGSLYSCDSDDLEGDSYLTFKRETAASFCDSRGDITMFTQILRETSNYTLLSTYGHYTCFAPSDSAFNAYLEKRGIGYADLTVEEKVEIANNHIIKGETTEYLTTDMIMGTIPTPNMNNRYLIVSFNVENGRQVIYINKEVPILEKDHEVHNGVVQIVGGLIEPSRDFIDYILEEKEYFSLFSEAFKLTQLADSVQGVYDDSYVPMYETGVSPDGGRKTPLLKKYGYTLFAETDEVFRAAGIENIEQLIAFASQYYGNKDMNDYTSRENPLNKFVSYHMLDRQMSTSTMLYNGPATSINAEDKKYEYYETMLKNRLIEVKSGNKINTRSDGTYIAIDNSRSNNDCVNGFVHALSNVLIYDENVMQRDVLNKRIRFDVFAVPPQLTNNNLRWQLVGAGAFTISHDFCGEYFYRNEASDINLWASNDWTNYQEDEMKIYGWYDFTLRMLPVPPGTYEIRLGYRAESWRGVGQLFIDGQIAGIPVDLRIAGPDPDGIGFGGVGWVSDASTTDNGVENDKMMRNRGYMKAPNSIYTVQNGGVTLRDHSGCLRYIIGTYTFQDYAPHYLRSKNVEAADREFHFDYIEYVPVSYLDYEGID